MQVTQSGSDLDAPSEGKLRVFYKSASHSVCQRVLSSFKLNVALPGVKEYIFDMNWRVVLNAHEHNDHRAGHNSVTTLARDRSCHPLTSSSVHHRKKNLSRHQHHGFTTDIRLFTCTSATCRSDDNPSPSQASFQLSLAVDHYARWIIKAGSERCRRRVCCLLSCRGGEEGMVWSRIGCWMDSQVGSQKVEVC
jgi:hypothetical protein